MNQIDLSKVNWNLVLYLNIILVMVIFLPFLPVSSYFKNVVLFFHIMLSFLGLGLAAYCVIIFLFSGITLALLIITHRLNTFSAIVYSFVVVMTTGWLILSEGSIQQYERDYVIAHSGKQLIEALRTYQSKQGDFPKQLTELQPYYLDELPSRMFPAVSHWTYKKGDQSFNLRFEMMITVYHSQVVEYSPIGQFEEQFSREVSGFHHWRYYDAYHP